MTNESSNLMVLIGMRIRARREQLNLTQEQASKKCGVTQSKFSNYEAWEPGKPKPTIDTLEKIATGLEMSIVDLLKE